MLPSRLCCCLCLSLFMAALASCAAEDEGRSSAIDAGSDAIADRATDPVVDGAADQAEDAGDDLEQDAAEDPAQDAVQDAAEDPIEDAVADGADEPTVDLAGDGVTEIGDVGGDAGDVVVVEPPESTVIISELAEGNLFAGLRHPKWVALTNVGDQPVDLSAYSLGVYRNDETVLRVIRFDEPGAPVSVALSGTLQPCESYVVNFENEDSPGTSSFFDIYGTDPSNFDADAIINGNDVIALFFGQATGNGSDAVLVDLYGIIGELADGEYWAYFDTYRRRLSSVTGPFVDGCPSPHVAGPGCTFAGADEWLLPEVDLITTESDVSQWATATSPFEHTVDGVCP